MVQELKKISFTQNRLQFGKQPIYHFHINANSRKKYAFKKDIFSVSGNVVFSDFSAAKDFSQKINTYNKINGIPKYVKASELYAMAFIDEIYHLVFRLYSKNMEQGFVNRLYENTLKTVGKEKVKDSIKLFTCCFMPPSVEENSESPEDYLSRSFDSVTGEIVEFEELILLKLANENPAFYQFRELFDDTDIARRSSYNEIFDSVENVMEETTEVVAGGKKISLIELLRAPMRAHPHSILEQLKYIYDMLGDEILKELSYKLLTVTDMIKEEERDNGLPGGSFSEVITAESLSFPWGDKEEEETENFSTDSSWMPRVVMVAKNVFVWLDQLSKLYAKDIKTLDQVPDDELKTMSDRGFSALWLIGIWERSRASKTIKQLMGNPEAVASAYSIYDYVISEELGGEKAFEDLRQRAWSFGIRIASDMVPNHMAIDSKWVNEHPEWFLSLNDPPFPGYTYTGHDLSSQQGISVQIEDRYYNKTDAAVTFKRRDHGSGETRYIYHGNDGTCMPWNDTAQLNYLKAEVREKVIETVIDIAKKFPIIRFDAAMTLAKRHYHRLWFPEPGSGGDIPSRAEHGMTKEEFNRHFPKEFWREVVDRVAQEAPETLLLAEAFWLMEGYFVRTLGMHRVYNSAFMNFLKNEENSKYRESIKNVLEFDPHILERHVNFLNNPDEETAVKQFGKGDKYFGSVMMMVTMPGLPMFGHGQIEGFSEKYGMEYRKAYWNESIDWDVVRRHEKEIFPLMHKRKLFAHVDNFSLFDFYKSDGSIDENVFAFTNGYDKKRVLIFFHNRFSETSGWIHTSSCSLDKTKGYATRKTLKEALGLKEDSYVVFRDHISNEQFVRSVDEIDKKGMFASLAAYKYQVFTDFHEVRESEIEPWGQLCEKLNGKGSRDLKNDLNEIVYESIHETFRQLAEQELFERLVKERLSDKKKSSASGFYKKLADKYRQFICELCKFEKCEQINHDIYPLFIDDLIAVIDLPRYALNKYDSDGDSYLHDNLSGDRYYLYMVFGFTMVARLSMINRKKNDGPASSRIFLKYGLDRIFIELIERCGLSSFHAEQIVRHIRAFVFYQNWWKHYEDDTLLEKLMKDVFSDENMSSILQINEYNGKTWFNKEFFENFTAGLFVISVLEILRNIKDEKEKKAEFKRRYKLIRTLIELAEISGYEKGTFFKLLEKKN